jgi:ribonuclease BN (tRNA processing enzyme)
MHIKILGSGTILSNNRNPSAYLIKSQNDLALLDCGPGTLQRLIGLNIDVVSLSALFLSHFHVDHYSDVLAILMRRFVKNPHINKNLTVFGPVGLKFWFKTQSKLLGSWFSDNFPVLIEMHKNEHFWAGLAIKSFPTVHIENSIAYKFFEGDKSIFYSSDTEYNESLAAFSQNSKLLILECSHRDEDSRKGHLTPQKAAEFINRSNSELAVLTHIYPENDTADLLDRVMKFTDKNVEVGFDFMEWEI